MPLLGTRGAASARGFGFLSGGVTPPGQQIYTLAGTYSFIVPPGITSISAVAVGGSGSSASGNAGDGGGGGGSGGTLGYINGLVVTPGETLTVVVGAGGPSTGGYNVDGADGQESYIEQSGTRVLRAYNGKGGRRYSAQPGANRSDPPSFGGTYIGTSGGTPGGGGGSGYNGGGGGGGAGGYTSGNGGDGSGSLSGQLYTDTTAYAQGSGGGGGAANGQSSGNGGGGSGGSGQNDVTGGGGGGATIYSASNPATSGTNGNGSQSDPSIGGTGGWPGGGPGGGYDNATSLSIAGTRGAVKILWGTGRSFPNNAGDV